jgi:protein-tyrosine kinase
VSLVEKALKKMASARVAEATATQTATAPATSSAQARRTTDTASAPVSVTVTTDAARPAPAATPPARQERQGRQERQEPPPVSLPLARTDIVITFDYQALRAAGLMAEEDEQRRLVSEYRQIKRPLVAAARGRGVPPLHNGRVIMVASALPGEGKTFTSINLALTLALEKETTVLLVDGDLAKAHLSRALGVKSEPGLTDLLLNEGSDVASAIIPTSLPGVTFLPAGRSAETATELLGSARMERLVADMLSRDPSRIVVFDSPPVLLTSESRALAGVVGQIVVVVRAEGTTHKAVVDTLKYLGEDKPIGLILNQTQTGTAHAYYGYGEYGEYGESTDSRSGR